jgi:O-antigen ligase
MERLDRILSAAGFALIGVVVLAGPWLFGAWEMWWFWPFAGALFAALAALGVRLLLCARIGPDRLHLERLGRRTAVFYVPFLAYALVRAVQAEVYMDAERSLLLHLTAVGVAGLIVVGFSDGQVRALGRLIPVSLLLLAAYGIANHALTGSARVLWAPGYAQYLAEHRASGSYFCPDHFAGVMELGFAVGLGHVLDRTARRTDRWLGAALIPLTVWAVVLTTSRGGGLTLGVVAGVALGWGLVQWPPRVRWAIRGTAAAAGLAAVAGFLTVGSGYVERFAKYPWRDIEQAERYQMIRAALRAWRTAPVFGIGPGMHQNLWPHFAATPDGDRARGIWPRFLNNTYYSYEVHSDWVQLLEEYGVVGLALFGMAAGVAAHGVAAGWRREARARRANGWQPTGRQDFGLSLGALLAGTAMAFHSLGDFNLQMPATVWLLAAMAALPLAWASRERRVRSSVREGRP